MENLDPAVDFINLPAYEAGPPAEPRASLGYKPKPVSADGAAAIQRLRELTNTEGLKASDLLVDFVARRVLPLQGQPHLISRMSGHRDPCRLSTKEMPAAEVANLVNKISGLKLEGSWSFGKRPYSRADPPLAVSFPILSSQQSS